MANSTILYACTDDGLAIFNKPGTLPEWLPPRKTLQGKKVVAAWSEPGPPIRVVVIADGVLLLSENGGRTWDSVGPEEVEEGSVLTLDYDENGHLLRAMTQTGKLWLSMDGSATRQVAPGEEKRQAESADEFFAQLPPGTLVSVSIPGGANMPATFVAGTPDGIQVRADGGDTWASPALPNEGAVTALARDPERRDRLYAATSSGFLFESGNRGQAWQAINRDAIAPVISLFVLRI